MIKKTILTSLIFLFSLKGIYAQSIISDALELRAHFVSKTSDKLKRKDTVVLNILKKYAAGSVNRSDIYAEYDSATNDPSLDPNPYINISGGVRSNSDDEAVAGRSGSAIGNLFSSVGGLDVTNIADGLAKFLVERAKQELSIAFFDKFQQTLKDEKYADLVTLFPQTAQLLNNIGTDIYQFSTYLQALREAFIQDLNNLYQTFPQVINKPRYDEYFNRPGLKFLRPVLNSSLYLVHELKEKKSPIMILDGFPADAYFPVSDSSNVNGIIKTLQLFSASLVTSDGSSGKKWISADSLWRLVSDTMAFKLYLGLIYQEGAAITFNGGKTLQTILGEIAQKTSSVRKYADIVFMLRDKIEIIEGYVKDIKSKLENKQDITIADYYNYFTSATELFNVIGFSDEIAALQEKAGNVYKKFSFVARNLGNIYLDISQKKYSSAVMNIANVFDTLLMPVYSSINTDALASQKNNAASAVVSGNNSNSVPLVEKYDRFKNALIRYGAFMAQVTNAKTSDDVKNAIASAALPVGSASIKKHALFNVALNAYVGPFYGHQKMATDKNFVGAWGMYSPVGISVSKGIGTGRYPASVSLFASVIDIGALTTFRFSNPSDTLSSDIKVKLSQIVAPGLNLVFGVPKWPVSIGGGYQFTPLLSKVEQAAATLNDSKGKRWQVFIAVDLPLLNFYNKSR